MLLMEGRERGVVVLREWTAVRNGQCLELMVRTVGVLLKAKGESLHLYP
jgi:hypothetical protein